MILRHAPRRVLASALVAVPVAAGLLVLPAQADVGAPAPALPPQGPSQVEESRYAPFSVTLVTGDRVDVRPSPGGGYATVVHPGRGRSRAGTMIARTANSLRVVPADAAPLVASGRLDARLFDVLELRRMGYQDGARADLPVMVTGQARSSAPGRAGTGRVLAPLSARAGQLFAAEAPAPRPRPGSRPRTPALDRTLAEVGVRAAGVDKANATRFWASTKAAVEDPARTGERTFLDGRRRLLIDRSVSQVGAPAAWRRGWTGAGVTVAVLDSGYDRTHPDLKGVVKVARDFTGSAEGITDIVGHGTHTASIVAGRGAASKGRYTGVAKGSALAIGKVCNLDCTDSAVLAGMVWASTTVRARVVTMSLGGPVGNGPDVLVQALETLTARNGTLFVVAAGNEGPTEGTINSPGNAASALTVGAVDRDGRVAPFSSRGPWATPSAITGFGLKPEVVAPGVSIVAARAARAIPEYFAPVRGYAGAYAASSGTSMATPHVAGAAAVLAQRHPQWNGARLKAAILSSAAPTEGVPAYVRGAGLVDLDRGTATPLLVTPAVVDFGPTFWPNGAAAPQSRSVTYWNTSSTPLHISLAATLRTADGAAVPDALALSTTRLTVPAARRSGAGTRPTPGTASVTVTYRPGTGGFGPRSALLIATGSADTSGGTVRAVTPVAGYRESESYTVTLTALDRRGETVRAQGSTQAETLLVSRDRLAGDGRAVAHYLTLDGATRQRVPTGRYLELTRVAERDADGNLTRVTAQAQDLDVVSDTAVTVDTRRGRLVRITVPQRDAVAIRSAAFTVDAPGKLGFGTFADTGTIALVPGKAPGVVLTMIQDFAKVGTATALGQKRPPSPYLVHVAKEVKDTFPAVPTFALQRGDFAKVLRTYPRQSPTETLYTSTAPYMPGGSPTLTQYPLGRLTSRAEFFTTDTPWISDMTSAEAQQETYFQDARPVTYVAGSAVRDRWNGAVFGAALASSKIRNDTVVRTPVGELIGSLYLSSDGAGHLASARGTWTGQGPTDERGRVQVRLNGRIISTSTDLTRVDARLGRRSGIVRIEASTTRKQVGGTLSTRQSYAWTFRSAPVRGTADVEVPLRVVQFTPALDLRNTVRRGSRLNIPVTVQQQIGSRRAAIRRLTVWVSYTSGKTWTAVPVTAPRGKVRSWTAHVRHPAFPGTVSLRARAVDSAGNTVDQTTITAYRIR